jgi:hypothetical protein
MENIIKSAALISHAVPCPSDQDRGVGTDGELPNVASVLLRFAVPIRINIF